MDFFDFTGDGIFDALGSHGIFDELLSGFGNIFEHGGGAFRSVLGDAEFIGHARTSGSFFEFFNVATDAVFDYQIWNDVFGKNGSYKDFKNAYTGTFRESIEGVREVLKGHAFMLQQLREHVSKHDKLGELLPQYEGLGLHLPSKDLTTSAYRTLSSILHPDVKGTGNEDLSKQLSAAEQALSNDSQRKVYEDVLRKNPKELEKLFTKLGSGEWQEFMNKAGPAMRQRIGTTVKPPEPVGIAKWYSEMHPAAQAGILFAGIAGIGVATYALANASSKGNQHRKSHVDRISDETTDTTKHLRGA